MTKKKETVKSELPKTALPNIHKHQPFVEDGINIVQVGLGGTGGPVANSILRLIGAISNKQYQERITYTGIDGDTFEAKNLGRQLCIPPDLGRNKAEVIISRYAAAYKVPDTSASFIDSYITGPDEFEELMNPCFTNIIIDNVDKNKPRTWIDAAIKKYVHDYRFAYLYLISSGNGEWTGQVSMGCAIKSDSIMHKYTPGRTIVDAPYTFSIPSPYLISPDLLDIKKDEEEEAMSCAARAAIAPQSMVANQTAAALTFNYVNAIITQFLNQLNNKGDCPQTVGTVHFDALSNNFTKEMLTDEYLAKGIL